MTKNKYVYHILFRLFTGRRPPAPKHTYNKDNDTTWYEKAIMETLMR